jgi:hypothetical protein
VAREAARKIVKAGDQAKAEIDQATMDKIASARTAFLDLDEIDVEIAAPEADARAIDLETDEGPQTDQDYYGYDNPVEIIESEVAMPEIEIE